MDRYILDGQYGKYLELIGVRIGEALYQLPFQKQLNGTRELLAKHYIRNTDMSSDDIAFLPGYQEINSFPRAFSIWTGMSISEYKQSIQ